MPRENTLIVKGYSDLIRSFDRSQAQLGFELRNELKEVGELVRVDAAARFKHYNARSAAGYRTYVTRKAVNVSQSIKRTTGRNPEYGALQMRKALLPALDAKEGQIMLGFEKVLDKVVVQNFGL